MEIFWTALRWAFWIIIAPALALVVLGALVPDKMTRRSRGRGRTSRRTQAKGEETITPPSSRRAVSFHKDMAKRRGVSSDSKFTSSLHHRRSEGSSVSSSSSARKAAMSLPSITSDYGDNEYYERSRVLGSRSISTPPSASLKNSKARGQSYSLSSAGSGPQQYLFHERASSIRFDNMGLEADGDDDIFAVADEEQQSKKKSEKSPFWGKIYESLGAKKLRTPKTDVENDGTPADRTAQKEALSDVVRAALKAKMLAAKRSSSRGGAISAMRSAWKISENLNDVLEESDPISAKPRIGKRRESHAKVPLSAIEAADGVAHACSWSPLLWCAT